MGGGDVKRGGTKGRSVEAEGLFDGYWVAMVSYHGSGRVSFWAGRGSRIRRGGGWADLWGDLYRGHAESGRPGCKPSEEAGFGNPQKSGQSWLLRSPAGHAGPAFRGCRNLERPRGAGRAARG